MSIRGSCKELGVSEFDGFWLVISIEELAAWMIDSERCSSLQAVSIESNVMIAKRLNTMLPLHKYCANLGIQVAPRKVRL
jgi:hypothetical protein